jgi:hypothetical protein
MSSLLNNLIFAADPSAHVFGDRLYLYTSYDEPYTNSYDSMVCYHAMSTDDLVNWVDHGRILHLDQVKWALSHMWAIDANYYQGNFYLVFCAFDKETSTFQTGLAISKRPEGPFTDVGPIRGVEWGQDPSLFIDEDEKPFLIWGGRGAIFIAELESDLRSIKTETITNVSEDIHGYEGPFLHKRDDLYYLTFPALDGEKWPQRMCHAVSTSPLGPYEYKGIYIDVYEGNSGTIHGSVVKYKEKWLALYHSGWVSGSETSRSLMMDEINYSPDGVINRLIPSPSSQGLDQVDKYKWQVILDAASAPGSGGKLFGTEIKTDSGTGWGYVTGFTRQEYGLRVLFQVGVPRQYELSIRYRSNVDRNARVLAGSHLFYNGIQNLSYDDYVNRGTPFPSTHGEWNEIVIGKHKFSSGDHLIRLSHSHNLQPNEESFDVDSFILRPLD